jgi:6-phosphogluconolactonase
MQQRVSTFSDQESLGQAAAHELSEVAARAVEQHGCCSLVLSGGSSPRRLYELLAQAPYRERVDWSKMHVFWSDERCVEPDDPRSNYHGAYTRLLQHVPVPVANIHRMFGEIDPRQAARKSAGDIRSFFKQSMSQTGQFPSFDCVLLGMGADGHIASIFPGDDGALREEELVLATRAPAGMPVPQRLSMSLPLLAAARDVFFIVCGRDKQPVLEQVLAGSPSARNYPAARLCARVRAAWFVSV